jgi:stage V sporulation protein D (sporulation-specific penicillin-binding protein)
LINGEYSNSASIGSMVIVAPIDDPKFVALVLCDTPKVGYYGVGTAGPVVNEIATQLLQYMNVKPNYTEAEIAKMNAGKIEVADYTDWTLADADASLTRLGLKSNLTSPEPSDEGSEEDEAKSAAADVFNGETAEIPGETDKTAPALPSVDMGLTVMDQYPKPGTLAAKDSTVFLYWD